MKAAPSFACVSCGRTIGKSGGHNVLDDGRIVCSSCLLTGARGHARLFPDCSDAWHDPGDHALQVGGTSAGTAAALGLWP